MSISENAFQPRVGGNYVTTQPWKCVNKITTSNSFDVFLVFPELSIYSCAGFGQKNFQIFEIGHFF